LAQNNANGGKSQNSEKTSIVLRAPQQLQQQQMECEAMLTGCLSDTYVNHPTLMSTLPPLDLL
jgi:hypothetical protein